MSTISSRSRQAHATALRRHDWRRLPIQVLCVLLLLQGSPLFALQEGWLTARPEIPDWLPSLPTAAEISIPSPDWQGAWQRSRWEFEMLGATLWSVASQEGGSGGGSSEKPTKPPTMPKTKVEPPDIPPFDPATLESVSPPLEAITLVPGWNFVSIPEQPDDTSPASVLAPIEGKYFKVWAVDNCDTEDPWKLYQPSDLASSDLETIDPTKGMWIKSLEVVDLPSTGTMAQKTSIHLCPGWNLIGFPLPQIRTMPEAMRPFEGKYRRVMSYDATATRSQWDVYSTDVPEWGNDLWEMKPGRAYWVLATEEVTAEFINEGPPPEVELFTPDDLTVVTEPIEVLGAVRSIFLDHWTLRHRPVGETEWTDWATGDRTTELYNLAYFDPTLLLNGLYEIQLTAVDWAGQIAESEIRVVSVEGNMKIGNFTLSFVDLSVPVSGLDLEIIRTYDSRDKLKRDFGVGWSLDIRQGSYRNNRAPGDGWQLAEGFLPCDSAIESKAHVTTIRLSDREIYRFALRLVDGLSSTGGGCYAHAEFEYVDGPIPGATLEILGNIRVFQETQSSDRVIDLDTLQTFEPQNVRLTTRDKRVFDLDLDIGVTRVEDPNGNRIDITEEGIFHSAGKAIKFERDDAGRITKIIDPAGNNYYYVYDGHGNLSTAVDAIGNRSLFFYDDHRLINIVSPLGVPAVRSEYDTDGRLIKITDAHGKSVKLKHDLDARREIITNRRGSVRVLEYDSRGNVTREVDELGHETLRSYDARDRLLHTIDPTGAVTRMSYESGNLVTMTDANGNVTHIEYDAQGRATRIVDPLDNGVDFTYDDAGNPIESTDALGHPTTFTYDSRGLPTTETDALGQTTYFTYDSTGRPTSRTDPTGARTRYRHDLLGNLISIIRERPRSDGTFEELETLFDRDALGRIVRTTQPDGSTTSTVYNPLGDEISTTDALGRVTTFEYDLEGNATRVTYPDGLMETRSYDADGALIESTDRAGHATTFRRDAAGRAIDITLPGGARLQRAYDAVGRIVRSTDPLGHVTTYTYDPAGRRVTVTNPLEETVTFTYDQVGNRIATTNAAGETMTHEYDAAYRRTRTILPDGAVQHTEFDALGRAVAEIDPAGVRTEYRYDPLDRLVAVRNAVGNETRYLYDQLGGLVRTTDANGHEVRFERDVLGRVTRRILADGASERMSYDLASNLTTHTDFAGRATTWLYDALDRPIRRTAPDGSTVEVSYTAAGQRASVTDARGTTTYTYDERNRQTEMTTPEGWKLLNQWDALGRRTALTMDLGELGLHTTTLAYDAAGRPIEIVDAHGGAHRWSYDTAGRPKSQVSANGIQTSFSYDSGGDLRNIEARDPQGGIVQALTYTLGDANERRSLREHDGTEHTWDYDALYRLVGETIRAWDGSLLREHRMSYDGTGNRLSETLTTADGATRTIRSTYDVRDRLRTRTTDGQATALTWDANGNLISETTAEATTTYTWDTENQLLSVLLPDGSRLTNRYDADGTRIGATWLEADGGKVTRDFVIDTTHLLSRVLADVEHGDGASDRLAAQYTYGTGLLAVLRSDGDRHVHTDALGSARALSDETAQVRDRYAYTAFGEILEHTGEDPSPMLFLGEPFDHLTGLVHLRARWLSSQGTFLSMDPAAPRLFKPLDLATYLYAHGDPVNRVDPLGRQSMADVMATLNTLANLSRMSLRVLRVLDRAKGLIDMINLAQTLSNMAFNGGLMTLLEESMGILKDPMPAKSWAGWSLSDATDSLSVNMRKILAKVANPYWWPFWLSRNHSRVKGIGLYLPTPFNRGFVKPIKTNLKLPGSALPLYLILGEKGGGSITGIGFVTNHHGRVIQGLWRMDFHEWHKIRGLGKTNLKATELSVWTDHPFHYHVLLPPNE